MVQKNPLRLFLFSLALMALLLAGCAVDNAVLYTLHGNSQRGLGNNEQAIQAYNQAIALNPTLAEAYYNRGLAYALVGDYDQAITDFDRAIVLKPDWADAYRVRGRAYRESGNYERAIEDFDTALALTPDFADAYFGRGLTYAASGQLERAIQDYDRAIELSPDDAEAYYFREVAHFNLGNYEQSIQDMTTFLELIPADTPAELLVEIYVEIYYWRGVAYGLLGDYEQAVQDLDKAIELDPDNAAAYYWRGEAYRLASNLERASQDYDQAIALNPDLADAYYSRGISYWVLGMVFQAVLDFESYLALAPDAPNRAAVEEMIEMSQLPRPIIDPTELQERPILHWHLKEEDGEEQMVLAATLADGRKVGFYPVPGAVWSPLGDQFAFIGGEGARESLYVMNLDGDSQVIFTPNRNEWLIVWQPAWSPDGQRVAVIVAQESAAEERAFVLVVIDVAEKKVLSRHAIPNGTLMMPYSMQPPNKFRWSPDGQKILVSWENAVVLDIENERTVTISEQPVVAEWTPEGDGVYYFTIVNYDMPRDRGLGGFYLRNLDAENPVQMMDGGAVAAQGVKMHPGFHYALMVLSPSGSKLAIVGGAEIEGTVSLHIYDIKQGEPLSLDQPVQTFQTSMPITALEWAPEELRVAVVALEQDGTVAIEVLELATEAWQPLAKLSLDWSEGGLEWLALVKIISWTQ